MQEKSFWRAMQTESTDRGRLRVDVTSMLENTPLEGAKVSISYTGEPDQVLEELTTDESGQTEPVELMTPPIEYSLEPSEYQPYSEYNIHVDVPGFESVNVSGSELLANETSIQPVRMIPLTEGEDFERIVIPAHTLFGDYPEKIPEDEIKPMDETGEIVLSRVVVPEYVSSTTAYPRTAPPPTTMYGIGIISKTWPAAKSTPPGPTALYGPTCWPSCLSP